MNRKGFTLIELLAVIIILAIISLISIPVIINTVEKSKRGAFKDSVYNLFSAAELYVFENNLENLENGVEINKLKLKNGKQFTSGVFYYKNKKIILDLVSDGKYCASGTIDDLIVTKGECIYDKTAPTIKYDLASSDWENTIAISLSVEDEHDIKEFKYKIVPKYASGDDYDWNIIEKTEIDISLSVAGIYNIYLYAKDIKDNVKEETIGEFKVFSYDNYKIWLEYTEQDSSNYNSLDEVLSNEEVVDILLSSENGINYLKKSTDVIMPVILNNENIMSKIINNNLLMIGQDDTWKEALKKHEKYDVYVSKILESSSLTNSEKYQYGLPCYIYNYGTYHLISTFSNYIGPSNGSQTHSISNSSSTGLYIYAAGTTSASQQLGKYYSNKGIKGSDLLKYSKVGVNYYFERNLSYEKITLGFFSGTSSSATWEGNLSGMTNSIQFSTGTNTSYRELSDFDSTATYGLYLEMLTNKYQTSGNYYVKSNVYSIWLQ